MKLTLLFLFIYTFSFSQCVRIIPKTATFLFEITEAEFTSSSPTSDNNRIARRDGTVRLVFEGYALDQSSLSNRFQIPAKIYDDQGNLLADIVWEVGGNYKTPLVDVGGLWATNFVPYIQGAADISGSHLNPFTVSPISNFLFRKRLWAEANNRMYDDADGPTKLNFVFDNGVNTQSEVPMFLEGFTSMPFATTTSSLGFLDQNGWQFAAGSNIIWEPTAADYALNGGASNNIPISYDTTVPFRSWTPSVIVRTEFLDNLGVDEYNITFPDGMSGSFISTESAFIDMGRYDQNLGAPPRLNIFVYYFTHTENPPLSDFLHPLVFQTNNANPTTITSISHNGTVVNVVNDDEDFSQITTNHVTGQVYTMQISSVTPGSSFNATYNYKVDYAF